MKFKISPHLSDALVMVVMNKRWIYQDTKSGSTHRKSRQFSHGTISSNLRKFRGEHQPILFCQISLPPRILYIIFISLFLPHQIPRQVSTTSKLRDEGVLATPNPWYSTVDACRLFTICTFLPEIINFLSLHQRERKTYPLSCVWSLGLCKITKRWRNAN